MFETMNTGGAAPVACDLNAIDADKRGRYNALVQRLRASLRDRTELCEGYKYSLDTNIIDLLEVAEWIAMEKLCCPFLAFELGVSAAGAPQLSLTGPAGTKAILREEFPTPT